MRANLFSNIIETNSFFISMPDCICSGEDYLEDIKKAMGLIGDDYVISEYAIHTEGSKYLITIVVNNSSCSIELEQMSDYKDAKGLVNGLNEVLLILKVEGGKQFYNLYGQVADFGIAYITPDQYKRLKEQNLVF